MKVAFSFLLLIFGTLAFAAEEKFSDPPSNLPVKKIFVHGVAQTGGYANNPNPPLAPQGYESNVPGYDVVQPAQRPSFENLPVQNQGEQGNLPQGFQSANLPAPPAPPPPPPPPTEPPPPPPTEPPEPTGIDLGYPLPECYTNKNGFMCCNKDLEDILDKAYDELKAQRGGKWSNCNIQQIANKVGELAEKQFNTTFETLVGVGDFASKSHFYHNHICKVERDNRYILAYASPRKTKAPGDDFTPYRAHHVFTWRK